MSTSEQKKSVATSSTSASSQSTSSTASDSNSVTANNSTYRLPSDTTLQHASKLAIVEDKPIMLDYWTASVDKKALVGVRESGEKLLVKSAEEYTSPIAKFYKSGTEYIIITENSIYLVSSDIPTRKIS
jgi:hypothetical protein